MPSSPSIRVAQRFFEDRYARLILAMSLSEAKTILGFPPNATPTSQEIARAYKTKAFENHPDRGGDISKMVEVNVAKDILQGKQAPTGPGGRRQRRPNPANPPGGWRDEDRVRYKKPPPPPPVEGDSFSQATSSIPGGIDWKFISDSASSEAWKGEPPNVYRRVYLGWVAYGQTDTHHVFAGIQFEANGWGPEEEGAWKAFHVGAPRKLNLIRLAPKMVKQIIEGLSGLEGATKYGAPKKYKVLDGTLSENVVRARGAGLSLKDAIIGSGAMPADSKGLKGRKAQITIEGVYNRSKRKAWEAEHGVLMHIDAHNVYDFILEVNGKGRMLKDNEVKRLRDTNRFDAIFSGRKGYAQKKNIARLRNIPPAAVVQALAENLNPGPLKDAIEDALPAYSKKKQAMDVLASTPLLDIALLEGRPLMEVYAEVLDSFR